MKTKKIYDESGNGFIRIMIPEPIEKVNPIEYYKNIEVKRRAIALRDILAIENPFLTSLLDEDFFIKNAVNTLNGYFEDIEKTELNENIIKMLLTDRKKEQISLLKNQTLNPNQLMALIFYAYKQHGFLYSKYHFENLPSGLEGKILPKLFYLKDDRSVYKTGDTNLTDGDLKRLIEQRKVIVSHFFEKENIWHCLFLTYNSIGGKENYNAGQPHFHYISSAFGISREEFIESMRTGRYKSTSIHIDLLDYGKQPINNKDSNP